MKLLVLFSGILLVFTAADARSFFVSLPSDETTADIPAAIIRCADLGYQKVLEQAKAYDIEVDETSFKLSKWDGVSYAWWSMEVTDLKGRTDLSLRDNRLQKLVQSTVDGQCL